MNYLCGGRLGDLIHCLYVMYANYKVSNIPGNLYITNDIQYGGDIFVAGIEKTYDELKHLISLQKYIAKFEIYQDESVTIQVNLNLFRKFPLLGITDWVTMLSGFFKVPLIFEPWITLDDSYYDPIYANKIIVHRTMVVYHGAFDHVRYTQGFSLMLNNILRKNETMFLSTDDKIYDSFNETFGKFHKIPKVSANTIDEIFTIINSCKFFIGNQTSPSAISVALHHPMLVEAVCIDKIYYFDHQYPRFYRYSENSVLVKNLDQEIFL